MTPLEQLRAAMDRAELPALLVGHGHNLGWLTGFTGSFGRAIVTPKDAVFITDSRYTLQAQEEVRGGFDVCSFSAPTLGHQFLSQQIESLALTRLGFEATYTTYAEAQRLQESLTGVELIPASDLFASLRLIKTREEIAKIRRACGVVDGALSNVERMIQPGVTEYDIALDIEFFIRRSGAEIGFDLIVVSGERSARPHGTPSEKPLQVGDFLTLDIGAKLDGYVSDITRTYVVGQATPRHEQLYNLVLEAQLAAIQAMRPGVPAREVDGLVREIFAREELASYFGHGLGHGLGREVHDGGRLNPTSDDILTEGQVWTVEPGLYLPGFGGVRIEDDVVVTADGVEVLTHTPKALTVLPRP